jgi:hypothetical protein
VISFLLLEYRHHLETEELEPLIIRNTIPLCMGQYERTFKSTRSDSFSNVQGRVRVPLPLVPPVLISTLIVFRFPGEEIDELVHYDHSFNEVRCLPLQFFIERRGSYLIRDGKQSSHTTIFLLI